jgi:hypothetical protein
MRRILLILLCLGVLSTLGGCYTTPYPYYGGTYVGVGTSFYYGPRWKGYHHHHHRYKSHRHRHHPYKKRRHYHQHNHRRHHHRGYSRR